MRSTVIYDMLGLNWSDDNLFCWISISQGLGVLLGVPLAGDLTFYFYFLIKFNFENFNILNTLRIHLRLYSKLFVGVLFFGIVFDQLGINSYHRQEADARQFVQSFK